MNRILPLFVLVLFALSPRLAAADEARDSFNEGMKLLAKGDFEGACAAFEKSEKAGKPTMATRYQLGRCNEGRQKYGKAYVAYQSAAQLADKGADPERATIARQRAQEVAPKAPKIAIVVGADREVEGMRIQLDGEPVGREDWGRPLPVAEGPHRIVVSAPKRTSAVMQLNAPEAGDVTKVEVPPLSPGSSSDAPVPTPVPSPVPGPSGSSGPGSYYNRAAIPPDAAVEMKRKNPALFFTGMGLVIAGGAAGLVGLVWVGLSGAAEEGAQPAAVGLIIGSGVFLSVGIPFMAVFGRKVPAEPAPQPSKAGPIVEPLVGPTGGGLRVRF